jgi:mannose-1-phosphate guanylyltransferase
MYACSTWTCSADDVYLSVITESTAGGIIVPSSGRLIACLGVDDLVIVDMPDTLMVTTRARSQEVKRLVKRAKESGWKSLL